MPGQCYGCGAEFGMFKKEHGCKNCGFSFCSKCLNEKPVPVPKKNNAKHRVCHKCFKILNGEMPASTDRRSYHLPQAYLKRMAALKGKESTSSGVPAVASNSSSRTQQIPSHLQKLSKEDKEIAMRLEKLKEDRKVKVSDTDLNARLAQLKGQPYNPENKAVAYQAPDRRTQVEQADDLLEQLCEEVEIDSLRPDPVKDIESRLAQLKRGNSTDKAAIDTNNINRDDKTKTDGSSDAGKNDLGKESKMGAFAQQCTKNIHSNSNEGEISVEEIQQLVAQATGQLEVDAQRELADLYKDQQLMEKLKEIQAKRQEEDKEKGNPQPTGAAVTSNPGVLSQQAASLMDSSDEENEDVQAKKILQRFLEEAKLDQKLEQDNPEVKISNNQKKMKKRNIDGPTTEHPKPPKPEDFDSASDYDDSDELPYCCICTEDATVRCRDCDLDLYCSRCFRESHQEMEITDHRVASYKAPKGYR